MAISDGLDPCTPSTEPTQESRPCQEHHASKRNPKETVVEQLTKTTQQTAHNLVGYPNTTRDT
jgi:hypothetical protein